MSIISAYIRTEIAYNNALKLVTKYTFKKTRPKWLRNDYDYENRMEIDSYNGRYKIGFECQDKYHYTLPIYKSLNGNTVVRRDIIKEDLFKKHKILVMYLPYTTTDNINGVLCATLVANKFRMTKGQQSMFNWPLIHLLTITTDPNKAKNILKKIEYNIIYDELSWISEDHKLPTPFHPMNTDTSNKKPKLSGKDAIKYKMIRKYNMSKRGN